MTMKENKKKTMQDFLVTDLDDIEPAYKQFNGKMYAGTLPSSHDGRVGETMFWLFEPDTQKVENSLVIWLNGGPGCSSFNCGVMMEHSPVTQPLHDAGYCCLQSTPDLYYNENSWTKVTTMLYVEHPIGTGFSYGSPLPETEADANGDMDQFLQNFYKVFEHLKPYDFYVFGESYAGMFIPSLSRHILRANNAALAAAKGSSSSDMDRFIVPLKGAALGNGWVDPKTQGRAVIDYSWWHGLIDKPTRDSLLATFDHCVAKRYDPDDLEPAPFHKFNVQDDCGGMWAVLAASGNPNAYDITTFDPNVDQVTFTTEAFYNRPEVKGALHAPTNITWHGCRWGEGRRRLSMMAGSNQQQLRRLFMDNDRPFSVVPYIAELLDEGLPVLVYNGDRDMTTNMVGQELSLNQMEWSGQDGWLDAPRGLWKVNDQPAGWSKEHKNLTFVVVYNSGHMVPYNQPIHAQDLVTRFLQRESFMDIDLPMLRFKPPASDKPSSHDAASTIHNTSSVTDKSTVSSASSLPGHGGHGNMWEHVGVAAVSVLVGFVIAYLFLGRHKNRSDRNGYEKVPDANGADAAIAMS